MSLPQNLVTPADQKRLPLAFGILIAMGMSAALWGAIYAACILCF